MYVVCYGYMSEEFVNIEILIMTSPNLSLLGACWASYSTLTLSERDPSLHAVRILPGRLIWKMAHKNCQVNFTFYWSDRIKILWSLWTKDKAISASVLTFEQADLEGHHFVPSKPLSRISQLNNLTSFFHRKF